MTEAKSPKAQFQAGLNNIALGLMTEFAVAGIKLMSKNVNWAAWDPKQPIPLTTLHITIKPDDFPPQAFQFTREQIADSWESLGEKARITVHNIASTYKNAKPHPKK